MIAELLPVRLYWDGRRGVARLGRYQVRLAAAPHVPGLSIVEIDYTPGEIASVLEPCKGWRDLEAHEIRAVRAVLAAIVRKERRSWN